MARRKHKTKNLPYMKRRQRRELKRQAASANGDTIQAQSTRGDQRRQAATRLTFSSDQVKADDTDATHKGTSSLEKNVLLGNPNTLSVRGGHHQPFVSYNHLTFNANGTGEEHFTLPDASLRANAALGGGRNDHTAPGTFDETICGDYNVFHNQDQEGIRTDCEERRVEVPDEHAATQRNQLGVPKRYLELELDNLSAGTLSLAGKTAKQVCLEATFDFLQKCIPNSERNQFWNFVIGETDFQSHTPSHCPIPEALLGVGGCDRSVDLFLLNCITTLSSSFDTPDATTLKSVFKRAITLCDALDDTARRDALHRTLDALDWHIRGDSVQDKELHRAMDIMLPDQYDFPHPPLLNGKACVAVSEERRREDGDRLRKHREAYDGLMKPLRNLFIESLQQLVAGELDK